MIAIVDYGMGNLYSVKNMLKYLGFDSSVTGEASRIAAADKLILPGVGSFDAGMKNLNRRGLKDILLQQAMEERKPVLGICLGMQLLGRGSEEGYLQGLGLIPFENKRFCFQDAPDLKIPHMGWDVVEFQREHPLTAGLHGTQRYYFVHSYHAVCDSNEYVLMTCEYGCKFAAAVAKDHVMGVQFHPEKSHNFGLALLENFAKRC